MNKSQLTVFDIRPSGATTGAYNLVLEELDGKRKLPIVIGMHEAQSIAIKMEGMSPSRPLTHDLFNSLSLAYDIELKEVLIYDLVEGIFFARLVCDRDGEERTIDARTSDAVALAVRFGCGIFCEEKVLKMAGIAPEGEEEMKPMPEENPEDPFGLEEPVDPQTNFGSLSDEELQKELDLAIQKEDYERAGMLRDEIDRRNEQ
jgi:bifunctional DNase/RNase